MSLKRLSYKWAAAIFVVALMAGSLATAVPAAAAGEVKASVTADNLNLRSGPGFSYEVLKVLANGQELAVLRASEDGDWSEVGLPDGSEGWVFSLYIEIAGETSATVSVDRLNLRAGPGFNSRVLKVLDLGQGLLVSGRNNDGNWLQVRLADGLAGWVYSYFVETQVAVSALSVKEASGGPVSNEPGVKSSYSILVSIENNQAIINLAGFPGEKSFTVALGLPGEDPDRVVADGKTGADGSARVSFEMPAKWSNGAPVKENRLVVTVSANDGSFTRSIFIQYYRW